jgi:hypothetical protein
MKTPTLQVRLVRPALAGLALLLGAVALPAKDAPPAPANQRELAVVIVDSLQNRRGGSISDFDRLDIAFHQLARQRKWPVTLKVERFAANTPAYETELRIVNRPLRQETPDALTFRGWMTLTVAGEKHDFGIVRYDYSPRPGEPTDDVLDKVFLGAARAAAAKFEPILFPAAGKSP